MDQPNLPDLGLFIGRSVPMQTLYYEIEEAAQTGFSVYIQGETGSGKELVARALHRLSPRRQQPLIAVNCAAIPKELAEDELFGHEKGAFTGAMDRKLGKFELAAGGTLFLDEIVDLAVELQAKLLRVLENNEIWRVGGQSAVSVDVRLVVAAASRLEDRILEKKFRLDLFHRLNVLKISIPPLRQRAEDIPMLADHFLKKYSLQAGKTIDGFSERAIELLATWLWPGNVRELENIIAKVVTKHRGDGPIDAFDIPLERETPPFLSLKEKMPKTAALDDQLAVVERRIVLNALERNKGHKTKTASELGISRKRLDRILGRHNIVIKKKILSRELI